MHIRRSVTIVEEEARRTLITSIISNSWEAALVGLAVHELLIGDVQGARRTLGRIRELVEPVLREHPDLRYAWNWKIMGLLIEAYLDLGAGRVSEASQLADRAAAGLQAA